MSAEQAEAPKNYVDFDEEEEKMRSMVKRKGVKDKTVVDSLLPGVEKTIERCSDVSASQLSTGTEPRTMPSTPLSPSSSTQSLPIPSSPATVPKVSIPRPEDRTPWRLIGHTIPYERARLSTVTSLKALEGHPLLLCLHRSG